MSGLRLHYIDGKYEWREHTPSFLDRYIDQNHFIVRVKRLSDRWFVCIACKAVIRLESWHEYYGTHVTCPSCAIRYMFTGWFGSGPGGEDLNVYIIMPPNWPDPPLTRYWQLMEQRALPAPTERVGPFRKVVNLNNCTREEWREFMQLWKGEDHD